MNDVECTVHIASGTLALGLPTVSACKIGGALFWEVGTVNVGIAFAVPTMFSGLKPGGAFFGVDDCHVARLPNNRSQRWTTPK